MFGAIRAAKSFDAYAQGLGLWELGFSLGLRKMRYNYV